MQRLHRFVALAIVAPAALWAYGAQEDTREALRNFMRPKLGHSQKLLEGLALEQFDVIQKEAQALSLLSREAEWNVLQTEEYLQHSLEFRRSAEAIRDAAAKKNLDGAALGYVSMTLKCVNCHKYVRDARTAVKVPLTRSGKAR